MGTRRSGRCPRIREAEEAGEEDEGAGDNILTSRGAIVVGVDEDDIGEDDSPDGGGCNSLEACRRRSRAPAW